MGNVIDASGRFTDFLREAQPTAYGLEGVSCMDDRGVDAEDPVLGGELYHQIPGGAHGIGLDSAVAMEMQNPGSFIGRGKGVHILGNVAAKTLRSAGFGAVLHGSCKAYEGAEPVAEKTAHPGNDTLVFERSTIIKPDLDNGTYWKAIEATGRILDSGLIVPTEVSDAHFASHSTQMPMVPKAQLVKEDHNAHAFLIADSPDVMFDVTAARNSGNPAYFNGLGALRKMHTEFRDYIPVDQEYLLAATAIRIGTISTHFLLGEDQQPLPIHRVA